MSRPKIMIHKKSLNGKYTKKRTQKDYSLSLKLQVVKEVELGYLTKSQTIDKYGNFASEHTIKQSKRTEKTPQQRILELEQELIFAKNNKQS